MELRGDEFNLQELANTAWAFATVGEKNELVCTAVAMAAQQRIADFKPQELANTA